MVHPLSEPSVVLSGPKVFFLQQLQSLRFHVFFIAKFQVAKPLRFGNGNKKVLKIHWHKSLLNLETTISWIFFWYGFGFINLKASTIVSF